MRELNGGNARFSSLEVAFRAGTDRISRMENFRPLIFSETKETLAAALEAQGEKAFRAAQILDWIYKKRAASFEEMTNLPAGTRARLAEIYDFAPAELVAKSEQAGDATEKFLLRMRDGALVECVVLRAPQENAAEARPRKTVCISTQVGCAQGCRFCASGLAGWKRNLEAGEIVAQLMFVCRECADKGTRETGFTDFDNIVVMGHSNCGGIFGAINHEKIAHEKFISGWVSLANPVIEEMRREEPDVDLVTFVRRCEEGAVLLSIENLLSYDWLEKKVCEGTLHLHALYYDITAGTLNLWDAHKEDFVESRIAD